MKKNIYYKTIYGRTNILKSYILTFFLVFASYPKLVLEVFLRKNMGERYFNMMSAITVAFILVMMPIIRTGFQYPLETIIQYNFLYYTFIAAFLVFSGYRDREVKREPSVFDFERFSQSDGIINPLFYKVKLYGKEPSNRMIQIWLEPLPFFLFGCLLLAVHLGTYLGPLLIVCAISYCLSYAGSYLQGDNFVMDQIDKIICNEDLNDTFVKDEPSPRGFRWYGKKPSSEELRAEYVDDICYEDVIDIPYEEMDEETEAR